MTSATARQAPRRRIDLLGRTALCGALMGFVASLSSPAMALPSLGGAPQVNPGGGAPNISAAPGELDVTLHGPRTVIDWASYDVAAGETVKYTFDSRSWIVLNRINSSAPPTVSGNIVGQVGGAFGGNIWFAAKNGMIFGNGAQVDAGGVLVSAAAPDLAGFLNPNNLTFTFPGSEVLDQPSIVMQSGSSINGHGGLVALIAPAVITESGTTVSGLNGSSVLYGAANGFQLRLSQNAPGDFDLVDFIIPSTGSGSEASLAIDLQNTTNANSVFVAAVSRSSAASAVINLQGLVTATAATSDGGDIVLSGGGGIVGRAAGPSVGGTSTDIYLRTMSASRDIQLENTGMVTGVKFIRPPPAPPIEKPVISPPPPPSNANGNGCPPPPPPPPGNGNGCGIDTFGCEVLFTGLTGGPSTRRRDVSDVTQLSNLTAGRDINLVATQTISLGAGKATRDIIIGADKIQANTLSAGRALTLKSQTGDVNAASVSVAGNGSITSANSVQIDTISLSGGASQTLNVQAAVNIGLGDGSGAASGGTITLSAGRNAVVNLSSATISNVTAGATADIQAGNLNIANVTAAQVLIRGGTINVGKATSAGDIYVSSTGGSATVGTATAGDDVYVLASGGDASLTNAVLTGAGADKIGILLGGSPDNAGNGRVVQVSSADGNASLGLGTGAVTGATAVTVTAGQDASVQTASALPGALTVNAARDATLSAPTVSFNAIQAGRDVTLMTTGGDFTSTNPLVATRNLTIGASGALTVGAITAANGSIALSGRTVTAGALTAGQDLTLKATGGGVQVASFKAGRDLNLQGSSLSLGQQLGAVGRDLSITTPGDFNAAGDLTAGRNITLTIGGMANVKALTAPGTVDIVANDLTLGGTLTAGTAQIESAGGALRVGGSSADGAPASGLWLDNAEFGRIHATGQVNLYAGAVAGSARGDLTVLQLDITPASTPQVNFLVGGGHNALIQGVMAPTVSGGIVHIGDHANTAWQPASVLVSGTIGAANYANGAYTNVRAFDHAQLFATQDIIIGSQRFIGLIQQTDITGIQIGINKPSGVAATGAEQNRVLVATGDLELSAKTKVVSQNTAPSADQSVGLFLTGKSNPNLIIDPPQLVDLYGSFVSPSGSVVSSFTAGSGVSVAIVDSAGNPTTPPPGAVYRFNSCAVDTNQCSAAATVTGNLQQNTPTLNVSTNSANDPFGGGLGSDSGSDSGGGGSSGGKGGARNNGDRNSGPTLLPTAPGEPDAVLADPVVTGAGSEEIWRKHIQPQPKKAEAK